MRAAIYNPYLDTLGGGERYTVSFAKVLLKAGWKVDIEWNDPSVVTTMQDRFGIDLKGLEVVKDIKRGDGYDLCFWVSDGSIPTLRSRKNLLHFQVPFHNIGGNNLLNKMKLFRIEKIICNSEFTKKVIDKEYGIESVVVYPPVDIDHIKSKRKENLILFVGRFSQLKQNKNQDVLKLSDMQLAMEASKAATKVLGCGTGGLFTVGLNAVAETMPLAQLLVGGLSGGDTSCTDPRPRARILSGIFGGLEVLGDIAFMIPDLMDGKIDDNIAGEKYEKAFQFVRDNYGKSTHYADDFFNDDSCF